MGFPFGDYIFYGLIRGGIYATVAVGIALVYGILNVINFAHGEIYMLGAYVSYFVLTFLGLDPIAAIAIAAGVTFFIGLIIEKTLFFTLRKRTKDWLRSGFTLTLGLSILIQNLVLLLFGPWTRGVEGYYAGVVYLLGVRITVDRLIVFALSILIITVFWLFITKTNRGKAIRAVAMDREAGEMMGIDTDMIYAFTFALSAGLAGFAGALLQPILFVFPTVGIQPMMKGFTVVILGGLGNIQGSIFGGFIVGLLEVFATVFFGAAFENIVSLAIVIIILVIRPYGLFAVTKVRE